MTSRVVWHGVALGALILLAGCRSGTTVTDRSQRRVSGAVFIDVAAESGLAFRHERGGSSPFTILQTAGSGCGFLDYDGDGWLDIVLLSGLPGPSGSTVALYRNSKGRFVDVTAEVGLAATGYAMGCAVADYDGDGDLDLYVTNYGPNALYRNEDGRFRNVTATAGVAAGGWSTSAAFGDYDRDGDLDLYVVRYVDFTPRSKQLCRVHGVTMACAPIEYPATPDLLYRNNGNGTFSDVTRAAGIIDRDGRGFGAIWGDFDNDDDPDLYVANDAGGNYLFENFGGNESDAARFRDIGLVSGAAYGERGDAEGSMGVDAGDYDHDGRLDLIVTNFQNETNALYHNDGGGSWRYASFPTGVGAPSLVTLGFGVGFLDYDNDADLDLFWANGHVQDTIARADPECTFEQPRQLLENTGPTSPGKFTDVSAEGGPALTRPSVARGAAFGDYDNDGDIDILVNNNGGAPMLLRNEINGRRHWLTVRLVGRRPNTSAIGARVTVEANGRPQIREIQSGRGYASTSDLRLHFGLGEADVADRVTVRWPGGARQVSRAVPANRELVIREEP
jgi:enediyne biosynthesis protein E4